MTFRSLFTASAIALTALTASADAAPKIGVYYFPGWSNDAFGKGTGNAAADGWTKIKPFPEREPLLGWYPGSSPATLRQQAAWMNAAHLDYVVFDWYFEKGRVQLNGPFQTYMNLGVARPAASILWANHGGHTTADDWHAIVDAWAGYFKATDWFKLNGRNVVFVFDAQRLANDATASGTTVSDWIDYAQGQMKARGLPPLYLVGGVYGGDDPIVANAVNLGFSSVSAYGMHARPNDRAQIKGYTNLDAAYRAQWQRMTRFAPTLKPVLPMMSGWDHRPWGPQPDRDFSIATPDEFKAHLVAARNVMAAKQLDAGVICCWNEYGEGSFIEPTKKYGKAYLNDVAAVFPR